MPYDFSGLPDSEIEPKDFVDMNFPVYDPRPKSVDAPCDEDLALHVQTIREAIALGRKRAFLRGILIGIGLLSATIIVTFLSWLAIGGVW